MLLGMPFLAASVVHEAWPASSMAAAPVAFDTAVESGVESVEEEEREEESELKTQLFFGRGSGEARVCHCQGSVGRVNAQILPESFPRVVAIRGPPAA